MYLTRGHSTADDLHSLATSFIVPSADLKLLLSKHGWTPDDEPTEFWSREVGAGKQQKYIHKSHPGSVLLYRDLPRDSQDIIHDSRHMNDPEVIDAHLTRFHAQQAVSENDENPPSSALARKGDASGSIMSEPVGRRGLLRRFLTSPIAHQVATQAVTQAATQAVAPQKPKWHTDLPKDLRVLPHVAITHGYNYEGASEGAHTFKHPDGHVLTIKPPETNPEKLKYHHRPNDKVWSLKTPDGDQVHHFESHGSTPLASLDTELEAQHNPKPEWFRHKDLVPSHEGNTDFEANLDQAGQSKEKDDRAVHYMVHLDRNAVAPGAHYTGGAGSHPAFRDLMRRAGLAHMLPHTDSGVGYDDIAIPVKTARHAEIVSRVLHQAGAGVTHSYKTSYGDNPAAISRFYGYDQDSDFGTGDVDYSKA